jgi:hypothetical protein
MIETAKAGVFKRVEENCVMARACHGPSRIAAMMASFRKD